MFIRRAEHPDDPWSGHIGLPGGGREPADEDLLATAIRETREEVSVALPASALLGPLGQVRPGAPGPRPLSISPFVFGLPERPEARVGPEVSAVLWTPLARLAASAGEGEVLIAGLPARVPCYRPGDALIWGLTHRILRSLLEVL